MPDKQPTSNALWQREYKKKYPWIKTLNSIKIRCGQKIQPYFKKGIKCEITAKELKELWFRDKAYLMNKPNLHRKEDSKNYTKENCEYMEFATHSKLHWKKILSGSYPKQVRFGQYSKDGKLIKEWNYLSEAEKMTNINRKCINGCIRGKQISAGGYLWKAL